MDNKSFVIYDSYYDTYRRLKKRDPNIALEFIDAILNYGFTGDQKKMLLFGTMVSPLFFLQLMPVLLVMNELLKIAAADLLQK